MKSARGPYVPRSQWDDLYTAKTGPIPPSTTDQKSAGFLRAMYEIHCVGCDQNVTGAMLSVVEGELGSRYLCAGARGPMAR